MKKLFIFMAVGIFLAVTASSALAVSVFTTPTEVLQYNPAKAYNGYVLWAKGTYTGGDYSGPDSPNYAAYLMDMNGQVVHIWDWQYNPGMVFLMDDGNIIARVSKPESTSVGRGRVRFGGASGTIQELDWDSNVVWEKEYFSEDYFQHHDVQKIWNKTLQAFTYITLEWIWKGPEDAVALGVDTDMFTTYEGGWSPDGIVEFNQAGEIIWRWSFSDHVVQNFDDTKTADFNDDIGTLNAGATFGNPADFPQKIDINLISTNNTHDVGPELDWNHCNSLDYNSELGQVTLNAKHMNEFYVVDHDSTFVSATDPAANIAAARGDGGDFVYRFGFPSNYEDEVRKQGVYPEWQDNGEAQMTACHDIQWIRRYAWGDNGWPNVSQGPPLPGGGNFLIFDNNTWNPYASASSTIEINPYIMDADGNTSDTYVNPPDAGYFIAQVATRAIPRWNTSNQVVWRYWAPYGQSFYSRYISGNTRLANGNTHIHAGSTGHMFQVTTDGEVVWEYQNPVGSEIRTQVTADQIAQHSIFRSYFYSPDHPALIGKDLTPMGTVVNLHFEGAMKLLQDGR